MTSPHDTARATDDDATGIVAPAGLTPASAAATPAISPLAGDDIIGSKQRWWFLPLFVISWFGGTIVFAAISGASIPKLLTVLDESTKETNLAIVSAIGGVVVMIITPLFGRLSDRTTSSWGMRKPWFAGGVVVGTLGALLLAGVTNVWLIALGWAVVQIGYGAVQMAAHTLLADQVPGRIRARVAAAVGVSGGIANILAAAIVAAMPIDQAWLWFVVPAALGGILVLPILFGYEDAVRTTPPAPLSAREILDTYWLDPKRYRDFAWAWASRFFMTISIVTISLFLFFLIVDVLGYTPEEAGGIQTIALLAFFVGNVVATVVFGWLSDRIGRRKVIIWISGIISGLGVAVVLLGGSDVTTFLIGVGIIGAAQGAYISVDVALMTEVLPSREDAGKDLGIVALAYQLPQVLAPLIGAGLVAMLGGAYTGLFVFSLVCSVIGGLTIIPIRGVR